jgi:hypothetical protein
LVAGAAGAVILSRFSVRSSTQQQAADQSALYARVIAIGSLVPLLGAFVVLLLPYFAGILLRAGRYGRFRNRLLYASAVSLLSVAALGFWVAASEGL